MRFELPLQRFVTDAVRRAARPLRDALTNARHACGCDRFLIIRHPLVFPNYYSQMLDWTARRFPEARQRFELRSLPFCGDCSQYALLIPWVLDPLLVPTRWEHAAMRRIESACVMHGVPRINPMDQSLATSKSNAARVIGKLGIRTPRIESIGNPERFRKTLNGYDLPLVIREDHGHAGHQEMFLVHSRSDLDRVPLERMHEPVVAEFIDVRSARDGYCRRYRYIIAGGVGCAQNIHVSNNWEVRGKYRVTDPATLAEERAYVLRPNPHHDQLERARVALELDFVGFDYSLTADGQLVVWEANTLPGITYAKQPGREFLHPVAERSFDMMLALYFAKAGIEVPTGLKTTFRYEQPNGLSRRKVA